MSKSSICKSVDVDEENSEKGSERSTQDQASARFRGGRLRRSFFSFLFFRLSYTRKLFLRSEFLMFFHSFPYYLLFFLIFPFKGPPRNKADQASKELLSKYEQEMGDSRFGMAQLCSGGKRGP